MLLGFLVALAARIAPPGPRLSHRARVIDLIAEEDDRVRALRAQLDRLQAQLDALGTDAAAHRSAMASLEDELATLGALAGARPVRGPGVVVTLRDSSLRKSPTGDPNDLVIHEQDIQAVVNAIWAGGAEAVSINGERVTSETAVRCVGNTLLLHGAVYSPPYVIAAIGPPPRLRASLRDDTLVERFEIYVEDFHLGFAIADRPDLMVPGFQGPNATYARID
jgi:uncharacterized protein YlxW (UPF0749 family)